MYVIKTRDFQLPSLGVCNSAMSWAASCVPSPIISDCKAYLAGSLPLLPTISVNAYTASVWVNTRFPPGVNLAVSVAFPASWGCTSSSSSTASNATPNPTSPAAVPAGRVRVIVQPTLFWSFLESKNRTCTASVGERCSYASCASPRKGAKLLRGRRNTGCSCPFA